jgi:hypothetical protein
MGPAADVTVLRHDAGGVKMVVIGPALVADIAAELLSSFPRDKKSTIALRPGFWWS